MIKKKLFTLAAAMVMLFAMAVPAFAALPTSGRTHFYAWEGTTTCTARIGVRDDGLPDPKPTKQQNLMVRKGGFM